MEFEKTLDYISQQLELLQSVSTLSDAETKSALVVNRATDVFTAVLKYVSINIHQKSALNWLTGISSFLVTSNFRTDKIDTDLQTAVAVFRDTFLISVGSRTLAVTKRIVHVYSETYPCLGSDQRLASIEKNLVSGAASSVIPKETFIVPYQKNDQFTGRNALLDELSTKLWKNDSPRFSHQIVLHGLGGVGKTQIALQYAHTHRDRYGNIFWVTAASETTLLTAFQDIGKRTGCVSHIEALEPSEIATRVLTWLNAQARWLLVFDNLEDDSVVEKYLPHPSALKHMLMTMRNHHCDISAEKVEVSVLEQDEAMKLLLTCSKVTATSDAREEVTKIVMLLGNLPLAIEQAAAYIREVSKNIFNFIQRYTETRLLFDRERQKGVRDYEYSVATTWSMSFSQIEANNSDASTLLRLMAFLNPDGILIEFLEAGRDGVDDHLRQILPDSDRFDRALSDLERFSLIKRQGSGYEALVVIHRFVQAVVMDQRPPNVCFNITEAIVKLADSAFPAFPHWNTARTIDNESCKYQYQVLSLLSKVPSWNSIAFGNVTYRIGEFFIREGEDKEATELLIKTINNFEKNAGSDDRRTVGAKANLGWAYTSLARSREAVGILEPLLEIAVFVLGPEDLDTLQVAHVLVYAYLVQNRLKEAVSLQENVLEARISLLGEEHPDILAAMGNLAMTYARQNNPKDAQKLEEKILEARTRLLGEEHLDTLHAKSNLVATYSEQNNWKAALKLEEDILEPRARIFGPEHPNTITTMRNLAITYGKQGNYEQALELAQQVFELRKSVLGVEDPDTKDSEDTVEWLR